jgi:DNA-binding response OmpR family regulator
LVQEIRSLYPSLPIVIASGRDDSEVESLLKGGAASAFVRKPYTPEQLEAALRAVGVRI